VERISTQEIYDFLSENDLGGWWTGEHIEASEKGRRLLDYLGISYTYEAFLRYRLVYRVVPEEYKGAIELVTNTSNIERKGLHLQWVHTVFVPIQYNDGRLVPKVLLDRLRQEFVSHFHGATRSPAIGDFLSRYGGLQQDKCELWDGFGTEHGYEDDKAFIRAFASKVGSKGFCNQDCVTILEQPKNIEIIETMDMEDEIRLLNKNRLFSLRSMIVLAAIAATDFSEQNSMSVNMLASELGFY
jgi:hypothetical protein